MKKGSLKNIHWTFIKRKISEGFFKNEEFLNKLKIKRGNYIVKH